MPLSHANLMKNGQAQVSSHIIFHMASYVFCKYIVSFVGINVYMITKSKCVLYLLNKLKSNSTKKSDNL